LKSHSTRLKSHSTLLKSHSKSQMPRFGGMPIGDARGIHLETGVLLTRAAVTGAQVTGDPVTGALSRNVAKGVLLTGPRHDPCRGSLVEGALSSYQDRSHSDVSRGISIRGRVYRGPCHGTEVAGASQGRCSRDCRLCHRNLATETCATGDCVSGTFVTWGPCHLDRATQGPCHGDRVSGLLERAFATGPLSRGLCLNGTLPQRDFASSRGLCLTKTSPQRPPDLATKTLPQKPCLAGTEPRGRRHLSGPCHGGRVTGFVSQQSRHLVRPRQTGLATQGPCHRVLVTKPCRGASLRDLFAWTGVTGPRRRVQGPCRGGA